MTEILRLVNPWSTGKHVERIVPLYLLHNLLLPNVQTSSDEKRIRNLVKNPELVLDIVDTNLSRNTSMDSWRELGESLFNPDRRVFKNKKQPGVHDEGAAFPVTGDLVRHASDDGLGRQLRRVLDSTDPAWALPLRRLLFPDPATDDAPAMIVKALLTNRGTWLEPGEPSDRLYGPPSNQKIAKFITNLIASEHTWCRLNVIRELALGSFMAATLQLLQYNLVTDDEFPFPVLCYAGLPPGMLGDPLVRACSDSWASAVSTSFVNQTAKLQSLLDDRDYRNRCLEAHKSLNPKFQLVETAKSLGAFRDASALFEELQYSQQEYSRRLRSLGANVGVAGPDGGSPNPRFYVDTPLLGVLVRGIVGDGDLELDEFVTQVYETFGLVLGIGCDDQIISAFSDRNILRNRDLYSLLTANTDLLRERLLRTGLARTYSDSHTEVTLYA